MDLDSLIIGLLTLPLMAAAGTLLLGHYENLRDGFSIVTGLVTAWMAFQLFTAVQDGMTTTLVVAQLTPSLSLGFSPEPLGALFALVAGSLWPLATLYSVGYMRGAHEKNHTRFFFFYAIAIHAAMGIALADGLLTLFVFYEILTFSTYPLVTHKGNADSLRSGRIYLGILVSTSIAFLFLAIFATWTLTGSQSFVLGGFLADHLDPRYAPLLLGLFAFGIGKAALMPIHRWLPAAMVAPTPVSALLHAVAVVKAGVFSIVKVVIYVFGTDYLLETGASSWLIWVACFTILVGSFVAMSKTNLKARLAYSTISQLSYIVLGAAIATPLAIQGASVHILMHAAGKITLFFCAGAIYVAHHLNDIRDMDGLGRRMPITFTCFALGALSIIGIPPLGGSWTKLMLMLGALDADLVAVVFALMLSSLLSLYYLGQPVLRGFFAKAKSDDESYAEAPMTMVLPLAVTALASVALFFYIDYFIPSFDIPALDGVLP
jgi:multicomponent Na+:H+ antiporter subunit D